MAATGNEHPCSLALEAPAQRHLKYPTSFLRCWILSRIGVHPVHCLHFREFDLPISSQSFYCRGAQHVADSMNHCQFDAPMHPPMIPTAGRPLQYTYCTVGGKGLVGDRGAAS